jgi:hypothetical protein
MGASLFEKNAGDPVPQVDPDDVKAVWKFHEDLARRHPGKQVGIGKGVLEHVSKRMPILPRLPIVPECCECL